MCGISGIIIYNNNNKIMNIEKYIKCIIENLNNRGPDYNNYFIENNIAIGHNRLSIIDLADRSSQPFFFKNLILSFNGEIYNYIELKYYLKNKYNTNFITNSDTEVLIQLLYYEKLDDALNMLNGMFLIVLYNKDTKILNIIRDRIGEKMCYYHFNDELFIFASNPGAIVKTLNKHDKKIWNINKYSLVSYLSSGFYPTNKTLFEGINGINPGSYIEYNTNNNEIKEVKWWIPNLKNNKNIEEIIKESIKIQERSDVNGYILYSGGIDSSIISYFNTKLKYLTLNVGELTYAKNILRDLGKEDQLVVIPNDFLKENISNFIDEVRKIINFTGLPTRASYIMILSGLYLKKHSNIKMILSGIGGSELFYGNRRMKLNNQGYCDHIKDIYHYMSQIKSLDNEYSLELESFKNNIIENITDNLSIPSELSKDNIPRWLEINTFLLNDLLINSDSIYMYYSIESRLPLLDYNLIESMLSKPPEHFFYNYNIINNNPSWNDYTDNSKKPLKDILLKKINKKNLFRQKFTYDVQKHILFPLYKKLCNQFLERKIVGWNCPWTKFNACHIGNLEIWFQEYENVLNI